MVAVGNAIFSVRVAASAATRSAETPAASRLSAGLRPSDAASHRFPSFATNANAHAPNCFVGRVKADSSASRAESETRHAAASSDEGVRRRRQKTKVTRAFRVSDEEQQRSQLQQRLRRVRRVEDLDRLTSELPDIGLWLPALCTAIISAYGRLPSGWISALGLLAELRREAQGAHSSKMGHSRRSSLIIHSAAMSACERAAQWRHALLILRHLQGDLIEVDAAAYNSAVSACEKGGQWVLAVAVLREMLQGGLRLDVVAYSAATSAMSKVATTKAAFHPPPPFGGEEGVWSKALELFAGMSEQKVVPDVIFFSAAASACASDGPWTAALGLLEAALRSGVQPDMILYGASISACRQGMAWQQAIALLRSMQSSAREDLRRPSVVCYGAALSACERCGGQWEQALLLFQAMQQICQLPDTMCLSAVVAACAKGREWQRVLRLLGEFECLVDAAVCNAAMVACEKGRQWQWALYLLRGMGTGTGASRSRSRGKSRPDKRTRLGLEVSAEKYRPNQNKVDFEDTNFPAASRFLPPDVASYSAVMAACRACGQWQRALELFREMRHLELEADPISFTDAISSAALGGAWQHALDLLSEMSHSTLRPNLLNFNSAFSACELSLQWRRSLGLLSHAGHELVHLDVISWNSAISACGQHRRWQQTFQLLE
ncbi:unnamed protein product, partial [Polarella glacialis]